MFITNVRTICAEQIRQPLLNPCEQQYTHLFFALEGQGMLVVDEKEFCCRKNDCFQFQNFQKASIKSEADSPILLIHVAVEIVSKDLEKQMRQIDNRLPEAGLVYRSAILTILHEFSCQPPYYEDTVNYNVVKLLYYGIVGDRQTEYTVHTMEDYIEKDCPASSGMQIIQEFISEHLSEDISANDLEKMARLSSKQINSLFRHYYNCTAQQYIGRLRLMKSKELLRFSNHSITEISRLSGFKSIHYFSRYFKDKEKVAPQEYKRVASSSLIREDPQRHFCV